MTERTMRIWIGLFVLLSLVLLGWLIILFGTVPQMFKPSTLYTVRFTDAPGIGPGTPVRRSGVRIGEVRDIQLGDDDNEDYVSVVLAIEPKYVLRHSEEAVLSTGLLGSDSSIDFVPRPKPKEGEPPLDRTPYPPGSVLKGIRLASVSTVLNQASGVVPAAQDTLADIRKSLQRLDKIAPVFEETLKEYRDLAKDVRKQVPALNDTGNDVKELSKDLRKALPNITRTSDEFRELAKTIREAVPDLRRTSEDVGATVRVWGKLGERLDVMVQSNQDKLIKVIENLNEALTRVSNLASDSNVTNFTEILRNVRSGTKDMESIGRNVDDITREGRTSVRQLNSTLKEAEGLMKDLRGVTTDTQGGPSGTSRIANTLKNADESMEKLNRAMTDVRELVRVIGHSDGTLNRIITDPTIYNRLDEALSLVPKMACRLDKVLKDFEVFADKLARHPEAIGLGGVVRPGNGIKDPPSNYPHKAYYPPPEQK